jgi:amino acid adenylation domain-containing protein
VEAQGGAVLSYEQLDQCSRILCLRLQQEGLSGGVTVGLFLKKSLASVVAIFAILRSGSAYVPVDPGSSVRRNAKIFASSRTRAILADKEQGAELVEALTCKVTRLELVETELSLLLCDWDCDSIPDYVADLAMVLYTSGSTGMPKGVQISHANALTFIRWSQETFDLQPGDVCSSIAPFHFDLSLFDLYVSLIAGATILLLDQQTCQNPRLVARHFQNYAVSICYATPTILKLLLIHGHLHKADHRALRLVLFAGEVFPIKPLAQLMTHWSSAVFYNLYGPTETNVVTFFSVPGQIEPERTEPFPIGMPCDHTLCAILVHNQIREITPGLAGELLVSGPSVTAGYLGDEDKTRRAFLMDNGTAYYRTGDIVNVNQEGELQFQQRIDRMVKRRGYRIELDEIETALNRLESVLDVAVCCRLQGDDLVIDAFLVQDPVRETTTPSQLKRHCLNYMPSYFLPDRYIFIVELPRTSSGKIDYGQLERHSR